MADYGVPDTPEGLLPWSWASERLVANRNYWFVTANAQGRPHSMPLWGVWLPDVERFWCGAARSARKLRNVAENPHVVVTCADTVEVVSVEGVASYVNPVPGADLDAELAGRIEVAVDAFVTKYWDDPVEREHNRALFADAAWCEVTPTRAFGMIERPEDFGPRATRWTW